MQTKASRAVATSKRTRQPSKGYHGGQYDAEAVLTSKFILMKQKNSSYKYYLVRLSSTPIHQVVEYFNREVGHCGWTSERAAYDAALIDVLINKGVDVSVVYDGTSIAFKQKVTFDPDSMKLMSLA